MRRLPGVEEGVPPPSLERKGLSYGARPPSAPKKSTGSEDHQTLLSRIRKVVTRTIPAGATVAVVSRGDQEIVDLEGRTGWHFPRQDDGEYAGYHPADSANAIEQLETVRKDGADYLLIPSTALWWLDYYDDFKEHLESKYPCVVNQKDTCLAFRLSPSGGYAWLKAAKDEREDLATQFHQLLANLLPAGSEVAVVSLGNEKLLAQDVLREREFVSSGDDPVTELEALREKGVRYLAIPQTAFGWLGMQSDLVKKLRQSSRFITRQEHVCEVYELGTSDSEKSTGKRSGADVEDSGAAPKARTPFPRFLRKRI
jgi:hypothetical protein